MIKNNSRLNNQYLKIDIFVTKHVNMIYIYIYIYINYTIVLV